MADSKPTELKSAITEASSSATEYLSARSRSTSVESSIDAFLAPLGDANDGNIGVSNSAKRVYKDRRIYVNHRTGLPVRPPTSFALFKHALRRTIKESKVEFFEFNKRATKQWLRMSDEEKSPYVERARMLADQFKKIEVQYLRRKVRQLKEQVKEYRSEISELSQSVNNSRRR